MKKNQFWYFRKDGFKAERMSFSLEKNRTPPFIEQGKIHRKVFSFLFSSVKTSAMLRQRSIILTRNTIVIVITSDKILIFFYVLCIMTN